MLIERTFKSILEKVKKDEGYINFIESLIFEPDENAYFKIWLEPKSCAGLVLCYIKSLEYKD